MKSLLALMLFVAIACAGWPYVQPFACIEEVERVGTTGKTIRTETTYVWRGGLAIAVTRRPGQWPSFRRRTDVDVKELERELEEAMREDAEEQARLESAAKAR